MSILAEVKPVVNTQWLVLSDESDLASVPNGVYEFDDPCDRFVVVIGGHAVNWATHQGTAWTQYDEALRVQREHYEAGNDIPFMGEPVVGEEWSDDYAILPAA